MVRAFALCFVFLFACGETAPEPAEAPEPAAQAEPTPAPAPESAKPSQLSASHILIGHQGASRSKATRSKEEAKALATKLLGEIKAGKDFAAMAKEHSEGPSGPRGGSLGLFRPGQMVPPFDAALLTLEIGEMAEEPVETPFGYHIIRRDDLPPTYSASHVLVQYKGSQRAGADITRSKSEAKAVAQSVLDKAMNGDDFTKLATEHSDGPSGPRGGSLGEFPAGAMVPAFEQGMLEVDAGAVVPRLVETPFGFHVIKREK